MAAGGKEEGGELGDAPLGLWSFRLSEPRALPWAGLLMGLWPGAMGQGPLALRTGLKGLWRCWLADNSQ